jgi:hypothetical protein
MAAKSGLRYRMGISKSQLWNFSLKLASTCPDIPQKYWIADPLSTWIGLMSK